MSTTFGDRALGFFASLRAPTSLPDSVSALTTYSDPDVLNIVARFLGKFFADDQRRVLVLGINPGRYGSGQTGVPFTDPVSLVRDCSIDTSLPQRAEMSASFISEFIRSWGGPAAFYSKFFLSAVCPIGFAKDGKNYNYYDDPILLARITPYIVDRLREQRELGVSDTAIVLGTGKNFAFLRAINDQYRFFSELIPIEHPRYILQYKRNQTEAFLKKYRNVFLTASASAARTHAA